MNDVYITSDEHYDSNSIIKICNRPFKNKEEMNEYMITEHNKLVKAGDRVYHLGDFYVGRRDDDGFKRAKEIRSRLNGQHYLIRGNHDEVADWMSGAFVWQKDLFDLKVKPFPMMVLCHYAMRSWRNRIHGSWHLYGHSHGNLPGMGLSFDVGVDTHNYKPYHFDEIVSRMKRIRQSSTPEMIGVKK